MKTQTSPLRVLVVDDAHSAADGLTELLSLFDLDVRAAYSGREAVEVATIWQPAMILMDIRMPDMDGHKALRRIRISDLTHQPYIVALSAWNHWSDELQIRESGFNGFLVKPALIESIVEIVERLRP